LPGRVMALPDLFTKFVRDQHIQRLSIA
jgi:hypothetical protein